MELVSPPLPGLSALYLEGHRRAPPGSPDAPVERVGSVLVKRAYRIEGRRLVPDPDGEGLRLADEFQVMGTQESAHLTEEVDGVEVPVFVQLRRVTREADLALFKPEGDLVVMGFHAPEAGGEVRVGDNRWMWRPPSSDIPDDPDTVANLFGWEPRESAARRLDGAPSLDDLDEYPAGVWLPPGLPELPGFRNRFFNAYRREFRAAEWTVLPWFHSGATIRITGGDGTEVVEFDLGPERVSGSIHWWCARGPDRRAFWCEHPLGDFPSDTLVVEPNQGTACRMWRGVWRLDGADTPQRETCRSLTVQVGEA